jgi:hypothetical protein
MIIGHEQPAFDVVVDGAQEMPGATASRVCGSV